MRIKKKKGRIDVVTAALRHKKYAHTVAHTVNTVAPYTDE